MKKIILPRWFELLISFSAFFLCFLFLNVVTDDYASFGFNCAAGQFSNYPYCSYYWGLIGLNYFYTFLYLKFPVYNWLGMSFVLFQFLSLYFLLRMLKTVILVNQKPLVIRIVQVLFVLFFVENIVYLSHTRSSLLFCGIALINLLFAKNIDVKYAVKNTSLFIFGMLLRPESAMGMVLIVSAGYLIYRFNLLHLLKRVSLPVTAMAIMFLAYFIDWSHTDQFLKKVEPEIEYKLGDKSVINISQMPTAIDSVKYQAAAAGFCFDTKVLTPEFFRSILLPGLQLSAEHVSSRFWHVISLYWYYSFLPALYLLLIIFCLFQPSGWQWLFKIVFFQIITFAIVYLTDFTGGLVAGRHFLNLELISMSILFFYLFATPAFNGFWNQKTSLSRGLFLSGITIGCFLLVSTSAFMSILNYKKGSDNVNQTTLCAESVMESVDNLYNNRIIVFTTDYFHLFDHPFSYKNKNYSRNTYLMFDVWTYSLAPHYIDYLKSECHCDPFDAVAFYSWLSSEKAIYIAEPWRYDLTSKYMNIVHGQKLKFIISQEYKKSDCVINTNLEDFELRKVQVQQ